MADPSTTEVVHFGAARRLHPPDTLPDAARRAFIGVVSSHTSGHFKPGDLPLLCRYCELMALAEEAATEMARTGAVLPDGKPSAWFAIHASCTKQLGVLSVRLRIGPSARRKEQSKRGAQPMSVYDEMKMQGWELP